MTEDRSPSARRPAHDDSPQGSQGISPLGGCLLAAVLSLAGGALIFAIATLVTTGELRFGQNETVGSRLWLVNEDESQGLAWSSGEVVREQGTDVCAETKVRFLLWRSDGSRQDLTYCDCYVRVDQRLVYEGACSTDE